MANAKPITGTKSMNDVRGRRDSAPAVWVTETLPSGTIIRTMKPAVHAVPIVGHVQPTRHRRRRGSYRQG